MSKWKNVYQEVLLDIDNVQYCIYLHHSGHDYPARITSDPDTSEPPDFELGYKTEKGEKEGVLMTKEELSDFEEEHHEKILDAIMEGRNC